MPKLPENLRQRLSHRALDGTLRKLIRNENVVDFTSNDYLGLARRNLAIPTLYRGSGGSRLLSGNHSFFDPVEAQISQFHNSETALIYNSGYDANIGLLSAILQRNDLIFYDSLVHASIRDGIALGKARSYKFAHNDLLDLKKTVNQVRENQKNNDSTVYVITESVFSMDGDGPDLKSFADYCSSEGFNLIVDEAHAVGVVGPGGRGGVVMAGVADQIFARIITFGKALGCHGAAILGGKDLREYLINFSRSLIYTTALSPEALVTIGKSYDWLVSGQGQSEMSKLNSLISEFKNALCEFGLQAYFSPSQSAIQAYTPGSLDSVKSAAKTLQDLSYDIRPILSPTVAAGRECLRISLHSFNTPVQIRTVLSTLATHRKN